MRDSLACGNGNQLVLESNFGSINYPTMEDSYPDNTECQWILNADEDQVTMSDAIYEWLSSCSHIIMM